MNQTTNIEKIKETARLFLMLDVQQTPLSPLVVKHPFTDTGIVMLKDILENPLETGNILTNPHALELWRKNIRASIDKVTEVAHLRFMITNAYQFAFLKFAMKDMSQKDFSEYLASAWIETECPNSDGNFTKAQFTSLFKQADKSVLMDEEERRILAELPDRVTLYRGVTTKNEKNIKAHSWTLSKDVANWFANRFDVGGTVYSAEIDKKDILALFIGRHESEVIVNPKCLEGITAIQQFNNEISMDM